jgi:hypothetical protein
MQVSIQKSMIKEPVIPYDGTMRRLSARLVIELNKTTTKIGFSFFHARSV